MAKRRTRKDKEKAIHPFTLSWSSEPKKNLLEANVKGQLPESFKSKKPKTRALESAVTSAKEDNLRFVKRDILKSIILVSLVLGLEVVIYLAWRNR